MTRIGIIILLILFGLGSLFAQNYSDSLDQELKELYELSELPVQKE